MFRSGILEPVPPMVGTFTNLWSPQQYGVPSSAVAEAQTVYTPIIVPVTCTIRRVWWVNGATVSASYNVDCGLYSDDGYKPGTRLVNAGSTAQGTANQVQFADVTDTTIAPGLYWLGFAASSTSATFFRLLIATDADHAVRMEEAAAVPLPATATPVESTLPRLYWCGFATTASP